MLKVDRSFVAQMLSSEKNAAIVRAIAALAETLRLEWTAEGVETAAQATALSGLGCRYSQGFLHARPLAKTDATRLLRRSRPSQLSASG
jgi:diguanylate cyclase